MVGERRCTWQPAAAEGPAAAERAHAVSPVTPSGSATIRGVAATGTALTRTEGFLQPDEGAPCACRTQASLSATTNCRPSNRRFADVLEIPSLFRLEDFDFSVLSSDPHHTTFDSFGIADT